MNKEIILKQYLATALWTAELDNMSIDSVTAPSLKKATEDIDLFLDKSGSLLDGIDEEQIGHDFWLSRNGHGTGFFDRDLGEIGKELQKISKEFGSIYVFKERRKIIIE